MCVADGSLQDHFAQYAMEEPRKRLKLDVKAEPEVALFQQSTVASSSQGSGLAECIESPPNENNHRRSRLRWRHGRSRAHPGVTSVSWREDLADAWSILEFANSEQEFEYMAQSMEGLCGLKLDHRSPKRAVDEFFERYTGKAAGDHQDRYYRHEQQDWLYVAELVTPSFYNKVFRGQAESSAEKAEVSACRCFTQDPDVLDACRKLPPALNKIRHLVSMSRRQKDALLAQGYDPGILQKEMGDKLHLKFRDFGCRTAVWDGNF